LNLLGNAIKFTDQGSVKLTCRVLSETAENFNFEIEVQDTGVGIAPDRIESIFEGYTQAHVHTTRQFGGTGLGLTISRNLIKMQGGKIWVESTPGKGSRFTFTISYPKSKETSVAKPKASPPEAENLNDVQILLAEDNPINQFLAKSLLENWGANVDVANNGAEALAWHEKNNYDLILMDVIMPEMDGVTATKEIRRSPNQLKARIPIIAFTANALKGDSETYLAAGMNDYLSKPYEERKLFQKISTVLNLQSDKAISLPQRLQAPPKEHLQEPLYNLSQIESLARGNSAFIRKMLELFVQNVPGQIKELNQNSRNNDWLKVSRTAHSLKSGIDIMLINSIKEDILFIEQHARYSTSLDLLPSAIARVTETLEKVLDQVRAYLSQGTGV
jgi:CheY-like chemotaxis protein